MTRSRSLSLAALLWGVGILLAGIALQGVGDDRSTARAADDESAAPFIGSAACIRCHAREHERWASSSHAQTFVAATPETVPAAVRGGATVHHPPGATTFAQTPAGFTAQTIDVDGRPHPFALTHVVGRMRIRMFVATLEDGRHQVLPGMLEVPRDAWFDYTHLIFGAPGTDANTPPIIEPGDPTFWTGPVRSWGARCVACHASGVEPQEPVPGKPYGARATWRELGVGCEACHGPGRAHSEAWGALEPGSPLPKLERLPTNQATELCLRCHLEHEVVRREVPSGGDFFERVDPTLLLDPERVDASGRVRELIYEGLSFHVSRCASAGDLRCTDCHDAHGSAHRGQLKHTVESGRLCVRCHEAIKHDVPAHTHHAAGGSGSVCTNCHMPALRIERGHGAVADHTIGVPRVGTRADGLAEDACTWCHSGGLRAPEGAPLLTAAMLRGAYRRYWPQASEPAAWIAALASGRARAKDAAPGLRTALAKAATPRLVRASAAALLAQRGDVTLAELLGLLEDEDSLIRREAVRGLASRSGAEADAAFIRALADPSPPVRRAAAYAALEGWTRVQKNAGLLAALLPELAADCAAVPNDDLRWFRLAAAREVAGDVPGAIAAYERQILLDPFAASIRKHVVRLKDALLKAKPLKAKSPKKNR